MGLLRELRAVLLLDWGLPARCKEQHDRVFTSQVLRKLDFAFCLSMMLGLAVSQLQLSQDAEAPSMLAVYRTHGLVVMVVTSWLQAYAIVRHTQWYDRHRPVLMPLLLLARAWVQAPAWARYTHWRAVHDTAQRPPKLILEVSSLTAAFFMVGHLFPRFSSNLVAQTAVLFVAMASAQPHFVDLLRWAPHHGTAVALHAWLQSGCDVVVTLLTNALAPPVQLLPLEQQRHPCHLLQLSLWLQLCGQWLFGICFARALEAASQYEFLRGKGVTMFAELPPVDSAAAVAAAAARSSEDGSGNSEGGSSGEGGSNSKDGSSSSKNEGSFSRETGSSSKQAGAHGKPTHAAIRSRVPGGAGLQQADGNDGAGHGHLRPHAAAASATDKLHGQWQQVEQALAQQLPEAAPVQLQRLSSRMLAAVTPAPKHAWFRRVLVVGAHAGSLVLLMALLWLVSGLAALAVHAVASREGGSHWRWAGALCESTLLEAAAPAWY